MRRRLALALVVVAVWALRRPPTVGYALHDASGAVVDVQRGADQRWYLHGRRVRLVRSADGFGAKAYNAAGRLVAQ